MGVHDGHRKRLKDRFLAQGLNSFEDHNVLELLLFYSIPRCDTNEIAHNLLNKFGSLHAVFDAPIEALCSVKGISMHSAALIKIIPEIFSRYHVDKVNHNAEILDSTIALGKYFLPKFYGKTNEEFHVLLLDDKKKVINCEKISEGITNAISVEVKKVVSLAINSNATAVVIAHNHPKGVSLPSNLDLIATDSIYKALRLINVTLLDHIIVADNDYISLADRGDFERYNY